MLWLVLLVVHFSTTTSSTRIEDDYPLLWQLESEKGNEEWINPISNTELMRPQEYDYGRGDTKLTTKRALSVLARWKPFVTLGMKMNNAGKYPSRSPLMSSKYNELDFVSAETRGSLRPSGQPLRWGRRRR